MMEVVYEIFHCKHGYQLGIALIVVIYSDKDLASLKTTTAA